MATMTKRTTIYFDPKLHKVLKAKSVESEKSISELVDLALRHELLEDLEDIKAYEERKDVISFLIKTCWKSSIMDKYEIVFHRKTEKELRKIPAQDRNKIFAKIQELSDNPYLFGHIKLSGNDELYRVRQGNYRIIYSIEDNQLQIYIIKIGHRKDIYGQ